MTAAPVAAARRVLAPTWCSEGWREAAVSTFGPAVAALNADVGLVPDPEQEAILDALFAVRADGLPAVFETTIVAPRQQLKTATILMAEVGWLFLLEEPVVLHTAQRGFAAQSAFRSMRDLILDSPALSRRLPGGRSRGIFVGKAGEAAIELASRQRIEYATRGGDTGRSLTARKVVGDEWYAASAEHSAAIIPTLLGIPDGQVVLASSAGKPSSAVLRQSRDRGRAQLDPRQAYFEWGDAQAWRGCLAGDECDHEVGVAGCGLDDEDRWWRTLPALGRRTTLDTVRSARQNMPPLMYAREVLGWWDDGATAESTRPVIDPATWARRYHRKAKQPRRAVVALDVAPDRRTASIGVAGPGKVKGRRCRTLVMVRVFDSPAEVVPALQVLLRKHDIAEVVLHPGGQTAALIPALNAAGVEFDTITTGELGQATAWMLTAVEDGMVEHAGQPELAAAVGNLRLRHSQEAVLPDRRDTSVDLTAFVSAVEAGFRWSKRDEYDDVTDSYL